MRVILRAIPILALLPMPDALAQSNIDPDHKFAWGENIGWTNWQHDRPKAGDGVQVTDTFLAGFVWAENIGWMNLGDGSPANGVHYANNDGSDFGVNIDPLSQELFGLAWGENIGWINFEGGALADPPKPARIGPGCRLHGFAWGENSGWLNLDDAEHFVGLTPPACFDLGDLNCDGTINALDIEPFILALFDSSQYLIEYPNCDIFLADIDQNGFIDARDIEPFIDLLFN